MRDQTVSGVKAIYLDYNATSPVRPEVRRRLEPFLEGSTGNPSSLHARGRRARAAIEEVRAFLLKALGDPKGRLAFTSGGTEADNLALRGVMEANRAQGDHLIVSSIEHNAVWDTARALEGEGWRVTYLPADSGGIVDLDALRESLSPQTVLVSVMHANNEVGTVQPIGEIGRLARERGVWFHTDAVQSFGKLPLNVEECPADLVSISGHKLGGLQGAGALYVRKGVRVKPLFFGGPQEHGLRAGTEGAAGIVALGAAAEAALRDRAGSEAGRIRLLRDRLEQGLCRRIPEAEVNGHPTRRLDGTLHMSFPGCDGETLLMALDLAGICASTGSACASGSIEPSHVLRAMGLGPERVRGSVRFSLGWATTEEEIEAALEAIPQVVERVRSKTGDRWISS